MIKVCIDARVKYGTAGGVESVIIGLAKVLSNLPTSDFRFYFLVWPGEQAYLEPHLGPRAELLFARTSPAAPGRVKALLIRLGVSSLIRWLKSFRGPSAIVIPRSDGVIEAAGIHCMHFVLQNAFTTSIPSIYHPHDLQHRHLPQLFSCYERLHRDTVYRYHIDRAHSTCVVSAWVKKDLQAQYGVSAERIVVIPFAALPRILIPTDLSKATMPAVPVSGFLLYPAQTWPHKNHEGLIRAVRLLQDRGTYVNVVCTGRLTSHFSKLRRLMRELGVEERFHFLGFLPYEQVACLYRTCRGVIIPTLFEAASFPLWEAFEMQAAVACSNVTSLPEIATGGSALIFDPHDHVSIADGMQRLWTDDATVAHLRTRGSEVGARYTWQATAEAFVRLYEQVARSR